MDTMRRSMTARLMAGYGFVIATLALGALVISGALVAATSGASRRVNLEAAAQARVVTAAEAFLATLDAGQRAKAGIALNAKTRTVWSNLPTGVAMQTGATERNGLKFGDMSPAQDKAALALLASALSREGYEKAMAIVDADEVLEQRSVPTRKGDSRVRFGRKEYYLAILGKPAADTAWMLQFGGHHLAINVTFAGSAHVLTPTHTGAQPASYSIEGKNVRPLGDENDKAFALINALTPEQRKQAILGVEVRNLVLGPGEDGKMISPEGVKGSALAAAQQTQLLELMGEWVRIIGDEAAAAKMAEAKANLNDTYFAWAGATTNGSSAYFRIQGPTVFIEYAPQGNPDHIHTIYRDPTNDYASKATVR
jgi:Protein of unknown function (DUF3500)